MAEIAAAAPAAEMIVAAVVSPADFVRRMASSASPPPIAIEWRLGSQHRAAHQAGAGCQHDTGHRMLGGVTPPPNPSTGT